MCGRFTLALDPDEIEAAFELSAPKDWTARYNVAPTQPIAVIANAANRKIEVFRWGLIPGWASDIKIGSRMINARAETLAEKPSYRTALKKRRCLVLADGFYEWKKDKKGKTPMYIQLKGGKPFAFAGLWEVWKSADKKETIKSCTIITTEPNALMSDIHDRMPVILSPKAYDLWLAADEMTADQLLPLLKPFPTSQMKAVAVSTLVNSPAADVPECIVPV